MGEHQKIFLITPTCADAQVFFVCGSANCGRRHNAEPRINELIHCFPVNSLYLSL